MHAPEMSPAELPPARSPDAVRAHRELVSVLASLRGDRAPFLGVVRPVLETFVDVERASGCRAEEVVVDVKRAAVRAHLAPESVLVTYPHFESDWSALLSEMVSAAIVRYYESAVAAPPDVLRAPAAPGRVDR